VLPVFGGQVDENTACQVASQTLSRSSATHNTIEATSKRHITPIICLNQSKKYFAIYTLLIFYETINRVLNNCKWYNISSDGWISGEKKTKNGPDCMCVRKIK